MKRKKPKIIKSGSFVLNRGTNNKSVGKDNALIIEANETYFEINKVIKNTTTQSKATS